MRSSDSARNVYCFVLPSPHQTRPTGDTLTDKIWFTYKARIEAAERLAKSDFHSQAILVWYALASAVLAIVTVRYPKLLGGDTDLVSAVLGVALLVVSMFVTNRDFRGRFMSMRSNYQALQALHVDITRSNGNRSEDEDSKKYADLLAAVENHSEMDDKRFRVFHSGKLSRPPSLRERLDVYLYSAYHFSILILLYAAPVVLAFASPHL